SGGRWKTSRKNIRTFLVELAAFDPIFMLATTKGLEITFESLPESIIQCIAMLSSKPEEITLVNYIGIASSLAATGLIISDANLSISRTFEGGAPNNPQYNWIPKERKSLLLCMAGYAIFTTFYFTSNVLALSLALLYFGGTVMSTAIAVEIVIVMLYKHYIDEALFGFSLSPKPSKLDYRIRLWVCDELVDKYGGTTTGEPPDSDNSGELSDEESGEEVKRRGSGRRLTRASRGSSGEFITQEFKDRMITIFTWWNRQCITSANRQEALRDVKDALDMIPTFIPPPPIESQRTTRQVTIRGSETGRVAPEPLPSGETKAET
ncbi:hypothetical protein TrRE_jg9758, partial [Triparma retinervis]